MWIEGDEAVGQDDALDRRVRDVALVPERDVLERRHGVAAQQPGQAGNLLAADRVALVRHRRGSLLALAERLLDLADLGLLQAADLEGELFERGRRDRQRGQQLGVTVALDDLRRHRRRLQAETLADPRLDRRIEVREHADRAGDLADADHLACPQHAVEIALQLGVPERQLHAERHRLGVHAVGAADHRRPPVLFGARPHRVEQLGEILDDQIAGLAHLQRLRGVEDVRGGQAEVQPPGGGPDVLGHRGGERDHVVLGDLLDFFDAGDVEPRPGPQLAAAAAGMTPASAIASAAASSTSSQVS